jgi:hypothetical protein
MMLIGDSRAMEERKGGREEGRKGGREEGRKGGREEGRMFCGGSRAKEGRKEGRRKEDREEGRKAGTGDLDDFLRFQSRLLFAGICNSIGNRQ